MSNAEIIDFCREFANARPRVEAVPILNWLHIADFLSEVHEAWTWAAGEGAEWVTSDGWESLNILLDAALTEHSARQREAREVCCA